MIIKFLKVGCLHRCDHCGKEFEGDTVRKFCSISCSCSNRNKVSPTGKGKNNPNWHGGTHKSWKQDNPKKVKANRASYYQISIGNLVPQNCEICLKSPQETSICGHHCDYSKPLDITWLCKSCHTKVHQVVKELERIAI